MSIRKHLVSNCPGTLRSADKFIYDIRFAYTISVLTSSLAAVAVVRRTARDRLGPLYYTVLIARTSSWVQNWSFVPHEPNIVVPLPRPGIGRLLAADWAAFSTLASNDASHPNARLIAEMGFDKPATEEEVQQWAKSFEQSGLGGLIVARNSRRRALGTTAQAMPKFDPTVPIKHRNAEGCARHMQDWNAKSGQLHKDQSLSWDNVTYNKDVVSGHFKPASNGRART